MELATFGAALARRWQIVLGCAIAAAVLAFAISAILPRAYSSESRVLVGSLTATSMDTLTAYQQQAQTYALLLETSNSLNRIAAAAGLPADPVQLAAQISTHVPAGGEIISIEATAANPADAARLAQSASAEVVRLAGEGSGGSLATVVQTAPVPTSPSSPRTELNVVLATLIGLALGLLAVFVQSVRAARLQGVRDHVRVLTLLQERFGTRAS